MTIHWFLLTSLLWNVQDSVKDRWQLVWSDEFDGTGLPESSRWDYEEGFVRNRELQYFTRARQDNVRREDGLLVIEARKERFANPKYDPKAKANDWRAVRQVADYTSASLITKGEASWVYGRFEIRAKLPTGRGTWPAIWTLGVNMDKVGWPTCGEIDIMENVGFDPDTIHFNVHTKKFNHLINTHKGTKIEIAKPYAEFHVYTLEWYPDRLDFLVDDKKYFTYTNDGTGVESWPFDERQFLILNTAIGGDFGGQRGVDDAIFPQRMWIDYVRVYRQAN